MSKSQKPQTKNRFVFLSGYSRSIGANSNSPQKAIVLTSNVNIKKRLHGIVLRYKPGLEDVGFTLESKYEYLNRGIAKNAIGDVAGACLDWNTALELGDTDATDLIEEHCK